MTVDIRIGDCREVLRTLSEDAAQCVITDPVWPNCPEGLLPGWDRAQDLLAETLDLLPAGVKRIVIVLRSDCDPRFLSAVPSRWPYFNAHWLQYVMPGYIGRKLGGNEIAYAFGEPIERREGQIVIPSVSPKAQPGSRAANGHPCSRAISHMEWLVRWWSEPDETILDPFAGSGTVGLAADRLQRDALLIELLPEYAEIAKRRLEEDRGMFAAEAAAAIERRMAQPIQIGGLV